MEHRDRPPPAGPVSALGGWARPQWALQLEGALETLSLWSEEVGGRGRDEAHVWASGPEGGPWLGFSCLAPTLPSYRSGDGGRAAQAPPIQELAGTLTGEVTKASGTGQESQTEMVLESCSWGGLMACRAVGRWWPRGHVSTSGSRNCGTMQPNSSAPTQILPEHSSLAQVGIVTNSTLWGASHRDPGPWCSLFPVAHWAEVKSCHGPPARTPLAFRPVPRGPTCCRGPAGPHFLSHLGKNQPPSHRPGQWLSAGPCG